VPRTGPQPSQARTIGTRKQQVYHPPARPGHMPGAGRRSPKRHFACIPSRPSQGTGDAVAWHRRLRSHCTNWQPCREIRRPRGARGNDCCELGLIAVRTMAGRFASNAGKTGPVAPPTRGSFGCRLIEALCRPISRREDGEFHKRADRLVADVAVRQSRTARPSNRIEFRWPLYPV
jgi:hypothetical protein